MSRTPLQPPTTDESPRPPALLWSVWRIDDNGNRFLVHPNLSREDAARLVAEYESRGHKQTYWAEPQPNSATGDAPHRK